MKPGKASFLVVSIVFGLPPYQASTYSAQPTRDEMESAQTDGFGVRRGKKRGDEDSPEPMRVNREAESAERTSTASRSSSPPTGSQEARSSRSEEPVARNSPATDTSQSGSSVKDSTTGKPSGSIVTGLGSAVAGERGNAANAPDTRRNGIVTGTGGLHPGVRASGNGIVSGAGTGLSGGVSGRPSGAGIVTGVGTAVAPVAQTGGRPGTGIVTGSGGPPGHANTLGRERSGKH
jgi:hypothetical protein